MLLKCILLLVLTYSIDTKKKKPGMITHGRISKNPPSTNSHEQFMFLPYTSNGLHKIILPHTLPKLNPQRPLLISNFYFYQ